MDYSFNAATGNFTSRTGMISLTEGFVYDNLDRLTSVKYGSTQVMSIGYQVNGNIANKTGLGAYGYHPTKVHAVETIENPQGLIPSTVRSVTYNAFNKPSQISETGGGDSYILSIIKLTDGAGTTVFAATYDA